MKGIKELRVVLNNDIVGYLKQQDEQILFQYDIDWQHHGFSISPFSLPLDNNIHICKNDNFEGVFGVFYDSLPDGWGRLLIHKQMQKNGINYERLPILTKLSLIGNKGLGGLQYIPSQYDDRYEIDFDLDSIASIATNVYLDLSDDLDKIYDMAGSSGGARPKANILINNEEWIVKFPCSFEDKNSGLEESKANELAMKCGINTNEFKLFDSKICDGYFGSKRFDRRGKERLHFISLSSILETSHLIPNLDYLHLFQVVNKICVDKQDSLEAFRRMCFNVLYSNKDDHGKNFGFIYDNGYHLSPFYDITKTQNKLEHEMTLQGNGNPNKNDLLYFVRNSKFNNTQYLDVLENIDRIINR